MLFQEIKSSKIWEMKGYLWHWERTKYSSGNNMSSNISLWSSVDKAYSVIWREYLWLKEIGARKYYIINKVRRLWNMWEELVYRKKKRRRMGFGVKPPVGNLCATLPSILFGISSIIGFVFLTGKWNKRISETRLL